ncbi:hypothetical protein [Solimonas marina]|uniref:Sel1 repeat-containing protein n=1 Tax=Solimonas marina TaxID=2714601 RepID=A0A969W7D4_9GAMM|nr:hypothetical protein [Solimonas marina]NKF22046.1 hypothetical protein [Solimonas marina]
MYRNKMLGCNLAIGLLMLGVSLSSDAESGTLGAQDVTALFDNTATEDARQQALQDAEQLADKKDAQALYLLGTLYAWGKRGPAKLVDEDDAKAARYLSNAVVGGQLDALPRLIEVELKLGEPREAAVWAVVNAHFSDLNRDEGSGVPDVEAGLAGNLLERCKKALGSAYDEKAVAGDAAAVINQFGLGGRHTATGSAPLSAKDIRAARLVLSQCAKAIVAPPSSPLFSARLAFIIDERGSLVRVLLVDEQPDSVPIESSQLNKIKPKFSPSSTGSGDRYQMFTVYHLDL